MNRKTILHLILIMASLTVMTITSGCGIRYNVQGTVIDMDTGQPVEGAVVSILWRKENFSVPGMGRSFTFLELADDITGPDGKFKIPKYAFRDYHLAAYKKGYVCWDWEDVFPDYKKREGAQLENGMIIGLAPFIEGYSKKRHAVWVNTICNYNSSFGNYKGLFYKVTEDERSLYQKNLRRDTQ
jgi:hypothetical protein